MKQLYDSTFPLPPYFNFRFSNGPIWIEYIPTTELIDYAYGGAVVNQSASGNGPPSLMGQINDYLISNHFDLENVAPETLYIFWGGSNDVLSALATDPNGTFFETALLVVGASLPQLIASQIGKLTQAGATNILVVLSPSLTYTPVISSWISPDQGETLTQFTKGLNQAIVSNVSAIATHGVNIMFSDLARFTQNILQDPQAYGLVNVTSPCLQNWEVFLYGIGGQEPILCSDPDEYLFWDGEHPTTKVQAIFAVEIMKSIGWPQNL